MRSVTKKNEKTAAHDGNKTRWDKEKWPTYTHTHKKYILKVKRDEGRIWYLLHLKCTQTSKNNTRNTTVPMLKYIHNVGWVRHIYNHAFAFLWTKTSVFYLYSRQFIVINYMNNNKWYVKRLPRNWLICICTPKKFLWQINCN